MTAATTTMDPSVLYRAKKGQVTVIDVPEYPFMSVDGHGSPAESAFQQALSGLYPMAYGVRFALRSQGVDEKVSPLEALWWSAEPETDFTAALAQGEYSGDDKASWSWRALIRLPGVVDQSLIERIKSEALHRHPELAELLEKVVFGPWREGLCVQTLHVGPYAAEAPTVEFLHNFIAENGYRPVGHHHEIYLGDPRRSAPERLKTILRQPVEPLIPSKP